MKCFYHKDLDGYCSGAIVRMMNAEKDIKMIPINYGDAFDWDSIHPSEEVYMVDFSLQPFAFMKRLRNACAKLHWIDHHVTALKAYENSGVIITGSRGNDAACILTWRYLSSEEVPYAVNLLGKYDTWEHDFSEDVLPFQLGAKLVDMDPANDASMPVWEEMLGGKNCAELVAGTVSRGKVVMQYEWQVNKRIALGSYNGPGDFRILVVNTPIHSSKVFDSVWDPEKYDLMMCWNAVGDNVHVSLYSEGDLDVSEIAKEMGGGGHKGAAGYTCRFADFMIGSKFPGRELV